MLIGLQKLPSNLEKFLHQFNSTVNTIRPSGAPVKVGKGDKKQRDARSVTKKMPLQMILFQIKTG
jgi:hypothetical protein